MEQNEHSQKRIGRRAFIGTGMAATLAMAAGTTSAHSENAPIGKDSKGQPLPYNPRTYQAMPTRNLGRTGHRVGIFSLGGQAVIETSDRDQAEAVVNKAIDLGVNYIDTASSYGGGKSEQHIGPVMKYRRHEVYLATKTHDRSYDGSMRLLEQSLERLQTDHLDCWQLHNVQTKDSTTSLYPSVPTLSVVTIPSRSKKMSNGPRSSHPTTTPLWPRWKTAANPSSTRVCISEKESLTGSNHD